MIVLNNERFNALKTGNALCVYSEVTERQFIKLYETEDFVGRIRVKNLNTDEVVTAELHIVDKENVRVDCRKPVKIAVGLRLSKEEILTTADNAIRFYENESLTN